MSESHGNEPMQPQQAVMPTAQTVSGLFSHSPSVSVRGRTTLFDGSLTPASSFATTRLSSVASASASIFGTFTTTSNSFDGRSIFGATKDMKVTDQLAPSRSDDPGGNLQVDQSTSSATSQMLASRKRSFDDNGSMPNTRRASSGINFGMHKKRLLQGHQAQRPMLTWAKEHFSLQRSRESIDVGHSKSPARSVFHHPPARTRKLSSSYSAERAASLLSCAIICHDVPREMNNQRNLKQHFGRFGDIIRAVASPKKDTATVVFKTHEMAAAAKEKGAYVDEDGSSMRIFFSKKVRRSTENKPVALEQPNESSQIKQHKPLSHSKVVRSQLCARPKLHGNFNPVGQIYARSDEEKLTLLEKIDSLLRKRVVRQSDISKAKVSRGTCPDMCPEKERYFRKQRKLLSAYETAGDDIDHVKAIKEYSRSSADQEEPLPHELRPAPVLTMTMQYLLFEMMPKLFPGQVAQWYDFVWNRTRAIRKDLTIQQIKNEDAVHINEQCARFHIFCAHHLCAESRMNFDPKINNENLEKTMKTVMDLYQDVYFTSSSGTWTASLHNSCVAELYSYYILLNINKTADVLNELQGFPPEIRFSSVIGTAVEAFVAVHSNNYVKFFNVVKSASFLQSCVLHRYFNQVRKRATLTMAKAFFPSSDKKTVLFPVEDFLRVLSFNDMTELTGFCQYLGIGINAGMLELNRNGFEEQDEPRVLPSNLILQKLENQNVAEIIANCSLAPTDHQPYSSFDADGKYIGEHGALLSHTFQAFPPPEPLPEASASVVTVLPHAVSIVDVKNIAKEIFHEVIDEMSLSLAAEIWQAASCGIILKEIFEEVVTKHYHDISRQVLQDALEEKMREEKRRLLEEEKRKQELQEKRRRELKEMEEKKQREKMLKEIEETKILISEEIASELQECVADEIIRLVASDLHKNLTREHRIDMWSKEEQEDILEEVVTDLSNEVCVDTWKEMKKKKCVEIANAFRLWKLSNLFRKWRRVIAIKLKFQVLTETFPNVPIARLQTAQIKALLPGQSPFSLADKRHSFPLDSNTELSLHSPMDVVGRIQRCNTYFAESEPVMESLYRVATLPLPFCDMIMRSLQSHYFRKSFPGCILWKIALRIPLMPSSGGVISWLRHSFLNGNKTTSFYTTSNGGSSTFDIAVCCHLVTENDLISDLVGSFSLVLALPPPAHSSGDYWATARAELETLISLRPAVPPVPLLIVLVGWDTHKEVLDERLGLSLLNFTFSSWAMCCLEDDEDSIFENYQKLRRSVEFLFEEVPALPSLATTTLRDFFESHLSNHYVAPLSRHISQRKQDGIPPLQPVYQVEFFNFVIESLSDVVTAAECREISWPPKEFSELEDRFCLPAPSWNSEENLLECSNAMLSCKVPPFPISPITLTESGILELALNYALSVCPGCYSLTSAVKRRVTIETQRLANEIHLDTDDTISEEETLKFFDWQLVIDTIISQHLTNMLYCNELGDRMVTFPVDALSRVEKYPWFEMFFSEPANYSLSHSKNEKRPAAVYREIFEDSFEREEYQSSAADISWMKGDVLAEAAKETEDLCEELQKEHEFNAQCTKRLESLLHQGSSHLTIMDSSAVSAALLLSDATFMA